MDIAKLKEFIPRLFSQMFIEILVYGNVTKPKAVELADIVEAALASRYSTRPLRPSQKRRFREVQLPDGSCFVYQRENDVHKSSSLEVYYQCSVEDTHNNMVLELFSQIISEPCFDILRTQEQLGYIVFSGVRRSNGVQGLRVIVQSDKSPDYVEGRVELFLHKMKGTIEEMADEVFQKHVTALAVKRLEKPKRLAAQNAKYWGEIANQLYNFDRDELEVNHLRSLTREDVMKFYQELIADDAPRRHKLSVHIVSTAPTSLGLDAIDVAVTVPTLESVAPTTGDNELLSVPALTQPNVITDITDFKQRLALFPLPKPFMPIPNVSTATPDSKSKL